MIKYYIYFQIILSVFGAILLSPHLILAADKKACGEAVAHPALSLAPIDSMFSTVRQTLKGLKNPFESETLDSNTIGKAHLSLGEALPVYNEVYRLKQSDQSLEPEQFEKIVTNVQAEVQSLGTHSSVEKRFALLEVLRLLQILESRVKVPLPETTQDEAQRQEDQNPSQEQNEDEEKSPQPEKKEEEQEDDEFDWKKTPDKYSPENKEMGSGGKSKKPVIILRSEVLTESRRYPRQYYEVINDRGFFSAPLSRPKVDKSRPVSEAERKLLHYKNTKKRMAITNIPVPEGFYVLSGQYQGFSVKETSPQEYSILFEQDPKTLPDELSIWAAPIHSLVPSSAVGLSVYSEPTGINKEQWPALIKAEIEKIQKQHLSTLKIVEAIRAHIHSAGYLYFGKGNEVNEQQLSALKAEYEALLQRYPKPIAMAYLKAFNCDGAAWIGAALSRDFFKIPTRVVGGSTAESGVLEVGNDIFEVISSQSPGHAWLEVWDESTRQWVAFDMTPTRNSPEGNQDNSLPLKSREEQKKEGENKSSKNKGEKQDGKQEQHDQSSADQEKASKDESSSHSSQTNPAGGAGDEEPRDKDKGSSVSDEKQREESQKLKPAKGSEENKKDRATSKKTESASADKNTKNHTKDASKETGQVADEDTEDSKSDSHNSSEPSSPTKAKKGSQGESDNTSDAQLAEKARILDRKFDPRKLKSRLSSQKRELSHKLLDAFYSYYLKEGLKEGFSSGFRKAFDQSLTRFLNSLSLDDKQEQQAFYLKKMDYLASLSDGSVKDLISRLRANHTAIGKGELRSAWLELKALLQQFRELKEVRDLTSKESEFEQQLQKVLREFQQIKHDNSASFDLVDRLYKSLPGGISRKILSTRYPEFNNINHMDMEGLAANIMEGKESDLVRMALVAPYTELFLNSERIPQYMKVKTFDRSLNPNDPREVVRTRRISDFPRMILQPKPGEHILAPTIRGEQLALGYAETRQLPSPKATIDKKVSVGYYDVSGSMESGPDSPMALQDALLMAFVDRALSERDSLGRPVHQVFLVPFDDEIGTPLEIKTREEAEQFILLQRISRKTKGTGGTNIEKVLMDFYDKVLLAYQLDQKSNKGSLAKLKKANLVLFSDGGSAVSYETVNKRQEEVRQKTGLDLHLNFVAIGAENKILRDLALNIGDGKGKPTYHFIEKARMQQILSGSDFATEDPEAFAFDKNAFVPQSLVNEFDQLGRLSTLGEMDFDFREFERILNLIQVQSAAPIDNSTIELHRSVLDLRDVTSFVVNVAEAPRSLRLLLAETALKEYLAGLNRDISKLTPVEHKLLLQLVRMKRIH